MKNKPSPKRALIVGAAWSIGTRWLMRGIGFISTMVMARLLLPSDYGIIAMAMLLVGLTQAMLDFGASTALLRKTSVTRDEVDSAWTLGVIQGGMIGLLLLAASPLAVAYFKEPRVGPVLWVFAACIAIAHAGNIGFVLAQKEFKFALSFKYGIGIKLIGTATTIGAGFIFRDYRALVFGVGAGYLAGLGLSYAMHPYRPRWNTSRIREIWAVTKWLMLAGIGGFVLRKGDELIAARIGSTQEFGLYNVGADLGQLPTAELGPTILRAFLPVLSSIQDDEARTNQAVLKTVSAMNTIILPVGAGFAALAPQAVQLILGPAWLAATAFVAAFAIAGAIQTICNPLNTLLVLRGFTRAQSMIVWLEFSAFIIAAAVLVRDHFLVGLVGARIVASVVNIGATGFAAYKFCNLPVFALLAGIGRPFIGAACMYGLVTELIVHVDGMNLQLVTGIAIGGSFFSLWCLVTWLLVGRPEGLESTLWDQYRALQKRMSVR